MAQTFNSLAPLLGFPSTDARGAIFFLGIDHFGGRFYLIAFLVILIKNTPHFVVIIITNTKKTKKAVTNEKTTVSVLNSVARSKRIHVTRCEIERKK